MTTTNRERTPLRADDGHAGSTAAVPDESQPPAVPDGARAAAVAEGSQAAAVADGLQPPPASPSADTPEPAEARPVEPRGRGNSGREESDVDLGRIAWLLTVLVCAVAVIVLVLEGYFGYAGVTLAVGMAAAINLT
jgi:hypothetical protein